MQMPLRRNVKECRFQVRRDEFPTEWTLPEADETRWADPEPLPRRPAQSEAEPEPGLRRQVASAAK